MSESDVEIIEKSEEKSNQTTQRPLYSGVFSALNALHDSSTEIPKASIVPIKMLPKYIYDSIFTQNWSVFMQRIAGEESLLFGPIKFQPKSQDFSQYLTIPSKPLSYINDNSSKTVSAILFCIRDSEADPSPFWPARFSFSINEKLFEAPSTYPNSSSAAFWVDISSAIHNENIQLNIYSNRVISGTPYYVVGMLFHPAADFELISQIRRREGIENWQKLYKLSDPNDNSVVESKLTIPLCCPLSQGRISFPVRGEKCEHISCFDAYSYFSYERFSGTWQCPICGKHCPPEELYEDEVYKEILKRTNHNIDSINVNYQGASK